MWRNWLLAAVIALVALGTAPASLAQDPSSSPLRLLARWLPSCGTEEAAFPSPHLYEPLVSSIETVEIAAPPPTRVPDLDAGGPFYVSTLEIPRQGDAIREIQVVGDERKIVRAELLIGATVIDRLDDASIYPVLRELYGMRGLPFHALKGDDPNDPFAPKTGLPLIALQHQTVRLRLYTTTPSVGSVRVLYEFYGSEERRRLAQVGHERVVYQVQHERVELNQARSRIELPFTGRVVAFLVRSSPTGPTFFFRDRPTDDPFVLFNIRERSVLSSRLLGIDVFTFGSCSLNVGAADNLQVEMGVGPGGSDLPSGYHVDVYAISLNRLRVMSGMGGLAYSLDYEAQGPPLADLAPRPPR